METSLKQFLAVAETGSISAACKRLNVTQPTITVAIRKLELQHGLSLFNRSSRGMLLTDAGSVLLEHTRAVQQLEVSATVELERLRVDQATALRIGCGYCWWKVFVRDLIFDYCRRHPGAPVHATLYNTLDGIEKLIAGDIDLFIGHGEESLDASSGLVFEPLMEVEDVYFVRQGHPLTHMKCTLDDVQRFDLISGLQADDHSSGPGRSSIKQSGRRKPLSRMVTSSSITVCMDLIRGTDGVMLYPKLTQQFFAEQGIVQLDVDATPILNQIGIYRLEERCSHSTLAEVRQRAMTTFCNSSSRQQPGPQEPGTKPVRFADLISSDL